MPNTGSRVLPVAHPAMPNGGLCIGVSSVYERKSTPPRQHLQGHRLYKLKRLFYQKNDIIKKINKQLMSYEITRWRWPGRQWQLMLVEHFWAGVHFICSWIFFPPRTLNYPNALKDIAWTNLFLKASVLSLSVPVSQSTCFFQSVYTAGVAFLPPSVPVFLSFSLEPGPISAPGSCPLRVRCGTRYGADEAGSREMSTNEKGEVRISDVGAREGGRGRSGSWVL